MREIFTIAALIDGHIFNLTKLQLSLFEFFTYIKHKIKDNKIFEKRNYYQLSKMNYNLN